VIVNCEMRDEAVSTSAIVRNPRASLKRLRPWRSIKFVTLQPSVMASPRVAIQRVTIDTNPAVGCRFSAH